MALLVLVAGTLGAQTVTGDQVPGVLGLGGQLVFASVPFTFLLALLRGRFAQADAVGELLVRLGETRSTDGLRCLLADALEDDSLELLYWIDNGWVKKERPAAELPPRGDRRRAWSPVELEGQRV